MGHKRVMPEHVALAVIWVSDGGAARLFHDLGVAERLASELKRRMGEPEYATDAAQLGQVMKIASDYARDGSLCVAQFVFAVAELSDGLVASTLRDLGALESVRNEAERWLGPHPVEISTDLVLAEDGEIARDEEGQPRRNVHVRFSAGGHVAD